MKFQNIQPSEISLRYNSISQPIPPLAQQGLAKPAELLPQATPLEGLHINHSREHLHQYKCFQEAQSLFRSKLMIETKKPKKKQQQRRKS
jgi:hypothetical protein